MAAMLFRLCHFRLFSLAMVLFCGTLQATAQTATSQKEAQCRNDSASTPGPGTNLWLKAGKAISHTLEQHSTDAYCIGVKAGQHVVVNVRPQGVRLNFQLLDPSQTVLVDWAAPVQLDIAAQTTGSYLLKVLPEYTNHSATSYELARSESDPASNADQALFEAHRLSTQVHLLDKQGKYAEALNTEKDAVQRAEEAGPAGEALAAQLLADLGWLQSRAGDFSGAQKSFEGSLDLVQRDPERRMPQKTRALGGMGVLYARKEEYGKAEELLQQALDINWSLYGEDHPNVASSLEDIVMMRSARGDFQRALPEIQRALAIDEKALGTNDPTYIRMLGDLAEVYIDLQDRDAAQPVLERQLSLAESNLGPSHPYVASALFELGRIARTKKNFQQALDYDLRAEKIYEQAYGPRHPAVAFLLNNIGNVYDSLGDYPRALEAFQHAFNLLQDTVGPDNDRTLMPLGNMARVYARLGDTAHAIECLRRQNESVDQAISLNLVVASEHERLAYIEKYSDMTSQVIDMNLQNAPSDKNARDLAALVILQRKGRVQDASSDVMSTLRRHLEPEDQSMLDNLNTTSASLAKISLGGGRISAEERQQQIASLEEKREKLEIEIAKQSQGYYQRSGEVTLESVKAAIPTNAALVEFAVYRPYGPNANDIEPDGEPRYVAYGISHDREVAVKDLGSQKEIDDGVHAFLQALRHPESHDIRKLGRSLDARIFAPIRELAGETRHWILSPDGELNFVPFESLVDERQRFLVEDHLITYVTTGRDLLRMPVAGSSHSSPLIVANPWFGDGYQNVKHEANSLQAARATNQQRSITVSDDRSQLYFAPLSATAQEAAQLRTLFPDATVLSGRYASKTALAQANAPSILHVATHGFFLTYQRDDKAPDQSASHNARAKFAVSVANPLLRSGLALAGANMVSEGNDNGILTALEAANLNLWGTKLVTLSACDTGVGEVKNGEGVYGLRRAFLLAGAQTVVTSLWPVSDYATRQLMTDYYAGLKNGAGRAVALREARLAMFKRKGREHPFYWAGFVQYGDWRSLDGN
jgi:CHAT domain-containing protein